MARHLIDNGFSTAENLVLVNNAEQMWQMLYSGRVDYVAISLSLNRHKLASMGYQIERLQRALYFEGSGQLEYMYIASGKNTDPYLVNKVRIALKSIKADGRFDKIMNKWQVPTFDE